MGMLSVKQWSIKGLEVPFVLPAHEDHRAKFQILYCRICLLKKIHLGCKQLVVGGLMALASPSSA